MTIPRVEKVCRCCYDVIKELLPPVLMQLMLYPRRRTHILVCGNGVSIFFAYGITQINGLFLFLAKRIKFTSVLYLQSIPCFLCKLAKLERVPQQSALLGLSLQTPPPKMLHKPLQQKLENSAVSIHLVNWERCSLSQLLCSSFLLHYQTKRGGKKKDKTTDIPKYSMKIIP